MKSFSSSPDFRKLQLRILAQLYDLKSTKNEQVKTSLMQKLHDNILNWQKLEILNLGVKSFSGHEALKKNLQEGMASS
jgi:hypothetical protein